MRLRGLVAGAVLCLGIPGCETAPTETRPDFVLPHTVFPGIPDDPFPQETATFHTSANGLPDDRILSIAITPQGWIFAGTTRGLARFRDSAWHPIDGLKNRPIKLIASSASRILVVAGASLYRLSGDTALRMGPTPLGALPQALAVFTDHILLGTDTGLFEWTGDAFEVAEKKNALSKTRVDIRQIALGGRGEIALATADGLLVKQPDGEWQWIVPADASRRWALADVRGAAYDRAGRLWFASPQGAGRFDGAWTLYSPHEGLPYDDFTSLAAGEGEAVWFGTRRGAIRFDGTAWEYRQGRRWLPDDEVRQVAMDPEGRAWFATPRGAACIESRPTTLADKARAYETAIDRFHRRTRYGYVNTAALERPGDLSSIRQIPREDDGLCTAAYGAAQCFAAAGVPFAEGRARDAFEALRFLSEVTQGGTRPAPPGFPARTILPTDGQNPNLTHTLEKDLDRQVTDPLWKTILPRWPVSADGRWYWQCDTTAADLDGHFFFYALYYDLVAETEAERERVRATVRAIADHLLDHGLRLVDWDGDPTRHAVFAPECLNDDPQWRPIRAAHSLSILSYLRVAFHITGDARYDAAARDLVERHGYAANAVMPGGGDEATAFMNLYNLIRYEPDPALRSEYAHAFFRRWRETQSESNPFFNFACAAATLNVEPPAPERLAPGGPWLLQAVNALKRRPLDLLDWGYSNSGRRDALPDSDNPARGRRRDGLPFPEDERWIAHWDDDPWTLDHDGQGTRLADGTSFLLAYYMGLHHGFIREE